MSELPGPTNSISPEFELSIVKGDVGVEVPIPTKSVVLYITPAPCIQSLSADDGVR